MRKDIVLPENNNCKPPLQMDIINLTEEHLFEIANISTGNYFKSERSSGHEEIETGGYGRRRLVKWISEDGEENHFEISGENKNEGWNWYAWVIDSEGREHNVRCLNYSGVVDYCDKNNINIRNVNLINE